MILKTPGVYIKETNSFPPSIVEASTAIPVFIGFTKIVPMDNATIPAPLDSVLISNMLDFIAAFGGEFLVTYSVDGNIPETIQADYNFYLYDSIDLYFKNGGGPCYVISAGEFSKASTTTVFQNTMKAAIAKIEDLRDATIVLAPDLHIKRKGVSIDAPLYGTLSSEILNVCGTEQNKFALFDYRKMSSNSVSDTIEMRDEIAPTLPSDLKYGALYYPWLKNMKSTSVSYDIIEFDPPSSKPSTLITDEITDEIDNLNTDLQTFNTSFTTGTSSSQLEEEYIRLVGKFDSNATSNNQKTALTVIFLFATEIIHKLHTIETTPNSSAELTNRITELKANSLFIDQVRKLFELVKLLRSKGQVKNPSTTPIWKYVTILDKSWYNKHTATLPLQTIADIGELTTNLTNQINSSTNLENLNNFTSGLYVNYQLIFSSVAGLVDSLSHRKKQLEQRLFTEDANYIKIKQAIEKDKNEIPSQGAIAGIYCTNDRARGVWKSPANITVQGIEKPMTEVSNRQQDELNVDVNSGKSINVIRTFTGKGPLVWGARTLAGNDNEWRYISVRRFFNFAEESIGKSLQDFLFEPNSALTWVKIKAMITSFLFSQWQSGALTGTTIDEAFFVKIGEDTTTPTEINNGIINIQIGLAVARPAEFIVIEFNHYLKS